MAASRSFLRVSALVVLFAIRTAAQECLSANPLDQTTVPLTMTRADAVPGSVPDGLLVRAGGAINTVHLEVRIRPGQETRKIEARDKELVLEEVHVGPLLPTSGFPVLWIDDERGESFVVGDGDALPLERIRSVESDGDPMTRDPELLRVTLAVAGAGGGFAGDVPVPLLILSFTGSVGSLEIVSFAAFGPDGVELTSVFEVSDLCIVPECEGETLLATTFDAELSITRPDVEPGSVPDGLLLQTAGEVQSGDFELFFDPEKLVFGGLRIGSFFVRGNCPVAFAPAFGPGELLDDPSAAIPAARVLRAPGHIRFGLAAVGLCSPSDEAVQGIATLSFSLHPGLDLLHEVDAGLETGHGTVLYGADGAPEVTFFRRVGACYRHLGQCAAGFAVELTADCLGAVCTWDSGTFESARIFRDGYLLKTVPAGTTRLVDPVVKPGTHRYELAGRVQGKDCELVEVSVDIPVPLVCPTDFRCEDFTLREDGNLAFDLAWSNGEVYDALEVHADGRPVAVLDPRASSATVVIALGRESIPREPPLVAARGGKECPPARCRPQPACVADFVCSLDAAGHVRLDWQGSAAEIVVQAVDLATGESTVLADGVRGLASFVDVRALSSQGTRYDVLAFSLDAGHPCGFASCVVGAADFIRGDVNADGQPNVADVVTSLQFLFRAGTLPTCMAAADVTGDGRVDLVDAIRQLFQLFAGAPPPPGPFPDCGPDSTDAMLGCASFPPCPGDAAFPGPLTCSLDAAKLNVLVSWAGGAGIAAQSLRLGAGARLALTSAARSASLAIPADAYGRTLPVILEATHSGGGERARSCAVEIPASPACAGSLNVVPQLEAGTLLVTWSPSGGTVTVKKDTGLPRVLGPGTSSTTFPLAAGDRGRIVAVTLDTARAFGGACPSLSAQAEVPQPLTCFGVPSCVVDAVRGVINVTFSPGVNLPDLSLQKNSGEPVPLNPLASSATVAIAAADLGKRVTVTLRSSSAACTPRSCAADVPPARITCMESLACTVDVAASVLRATWQPAVNLTTLVIDKDGSRLQSLPPDAEGLNVVFTEADRGRDVQLTLRGRDAAGVEVCTRQCTVTIPPPSPTICDPAQELFLPADVFSDNHGPGTTNAIAVYSCDRGRAETGPERAFRFVAPATQKLFVHFTDLSTNLDLFILDGDAGPCDGQSCRVAATSTNTADLTFVLPVEGGKTYFFVVDSPGELGSFRLRLEDLVEGQCQIARSTHCGDFLFGSNADFGSTNSRLTYSCSRFNFWNGPEIAYYFSWFEDQLVTVDFSNLSADVDLFVLEDQSTGCDGEFCLDASVASGINNEQVSFIARNGRNYFVVVDGFDGAVSSFQMQVNCQPAPGQFIRGDANNDGNVDISDLAVILQVAQGQTPFCADACDTDDDGVVLEADFTRLSNHLFFAGEPPATPFPGCGVDPTADSLSCDNPPGGCNP